MAGFTDTLSQRPLVAIVLINAVISILIYHANPVINFDGIVYLSSAQAMLDGRWQDAFSIYRWPFYPLLIALTSKLIPNLEIAAHFVNFVLFNLLTLGFFYCAKSLGATSKTLLLSALLIGLFFPSLLKFRAFLIRDIGFWVGLLWSLYFIIRFRQTRDSKLLIAWFFLLLLAALFRLEAIAYLCLAPIVFLIFRSHSKLTKIFASGVFVAGLAVMAVGMFTWHAIAPNINIFQTTASDASFLELAFDALAVQNLSFMDICLRLMAALQQVIYETVRRSSVVYFLLALFVFHKKLLILEDDTARLLVTYAIIAALVPIVFASGSGFVISRYVMPLVLMITLVSVFALPTIVEHLREIGRHRLSGYASLIIVIVLVFISVDRFTFSHNQREHKASGEWVLSALGANEQVYSNNAKILYYAGVNPHYEHANAYSSSLFLDYWQQGLLSDYSALALVVNANEPTELQLREMLQSQLGPPVKVFDGERGSQVVVFLRP